jgi:hypothetical protein
LASADGSGWVAVASTGTATGATTLDNEVYLGNILTGEVCRVAHSRTKSDEGSWGYWSETHPQISADGFRILYTSDWLGSSTVDTYVVDLRPQDVTILTANLDNAVVSEPYSKALSITGGTAPYTCSIAAGTLPAGITFANCTLSGTSTAVESQALTFQACDAVPDCVAKGLTLTTQERPQVTTTAPLPDAIVGSLYSQGFSAIKGVAPYVWSTAGNTCSTAFVGSDLTGTPLCLETCSFSATVTDSHAQPISATSPFVFDVVVPSGGGCPCAPSDFTVEVTE